MKQILKICFTHLRLVHGHGCICSCLGPMIDAQMKCKLFEYRYREDAHNMSNTSKQLEGTGEVFCLGEICVKVLIWVEIGYS